MGKKQRNTNKERSAAPAKAAGGLPTGRDSDVSDLESIAYSSVAGDFSNEEDDVNDAFVLLDSFSEQIENAQDKRIATRMKAIDNIHLLLKKFYMADNVEKWKMSLCEIVEKNLKRTPEEALRACALASLLSIQMGLDIENEIGQSLSSMRHMCADPAMPENVRCLCAQTIGICCYFSVEQVNTQQECMQTLRKIWWDMKPSTATPTLFSACVLSWVLLLERANSHVIGKTIEETQPKLCNFLDAISVEVRIVAGEALAVLHEIAVDNVDEEFRFHNHTHLKEVLEELALDSAKYHAKRDKKAQKFSFRQINDAIFNDTPPQTRVKFNKHETLDMEGCHSKLLYDTLCHILKGDVNTHLGTNVLLREVFDLGPVAAEDDEKALSKAEKVERMNALNAVSKQRNIHRAKQRDKKVY